MHIRTLLQQTKKDIFQITDDLELAYKECREAETDDWAGFQNALADLIHAARLLGYISGGGDILWFAALGEMRAQEGSVATAALDEFREYAGRMAAAQS